MTNTLAIDISGVNTAIGTAVFSNKYDDRKKDNENPLNDHKKKKIKISEFIDNDNTKFTGAVRAEDVFRRNVIFTFLSTVMIASYIQGDFLEITIEYMLLSIIVCVIIHLINIPLLKISKKYPTSQWILYLRLFLEFIYIIAILIFFQFIFNMTFGLYQQSGMDVIELTILFIVVTSLMISIIISYFFITAEEYLVFDEKEK